VDHLGDALLLEVADELLARRPRVHAALGHVTLKLQRAHEAPVQRRGPVPERARRREQPFDAAPGTGSDHLLVVQGQDHTPSRRRRRARRRRLRSLARSSGPGPRASLEPEA
jgi:hypothetical protein